MSRVLGIAAFLFALALTLFIAHLLLGCSVDCSMRPSRTIDCREAGTLAELQECVRR